MKLGVGMALALFSVSIVLTGCNEQQSHDESANPKPNAPPATVIPTVIRGQVYLSFASGNTLKLSGVEVQLLEADETLVNSLVKMFRDRVASLRHKLIDLRVEKNSERRRLDELHLDESEALTSINRVISFCMSAEAAIPEHWPTPISVAVTDADGKFTIQVPKRDRLCIAAFATRKIDRYEVERYGWIVPLQTDARNEVFLNNNNLAANPNEN